MLYVPRACVLLRGLARALPHILSHIWPHILSHIWPHVLTHIWPRTWPLCLPLVWRIVSPWVVSPIVLPLGRLFQVFQFRQLLQVLRRLHFIAAAVTVAVDRIGLDVVFADHLGDRTDRLNVVVKIRDVQEAGLLQTNIDKRRLHPGQHARDLALIDVAGEAAMLLALEIELG